MDEIPGSQSFLEPSRSRGALSDVSFPSIPLFEPARSGFYYSGFLKLHYIEWGDEKAPALILVHGGFDHSRSWDRIALSLSDRYRVIVPDLRGHGDSEWSPEGSYGLIDHVEDQVALYRHLRLQSALVVGHSYGGRVVLRHAGIYPETVSRLTVIEGLGPLPSERAEWRAIPIARRIRDYHERKLSLPGRLERTFSSVEACANRFTDRNSEIRPDLAHHLAYHGIRLGADGLYRWKFDPRVGLTYPIDISHADEIGLFKAISSPTMFVHGGRSASAPPEGDPRAEAVQNVVIRRMQEAGHWVHHDRPDEFLAALSDFLSS